MNISFFSYFLFIFFSFSSLVSKAESFKISWAELKKEAQDLYQIPSIPALSLSQLTEQNNLYIDHLGTRLPGFFAMTNQKNSSAKVSQLMLSTSLSGLPDFGGPETTLNLDIKSMMFFILEELSKSQDLVKADRLFKKLALAFTNCQQVQYRVIREIFQELNKQSSLQIRIALLLDDIKEKWLLQTIYHLEDKLQNGIEVHLKSSYLKAIGELFGIPGFRQALTDPHAQNNVDKIRAARVYRSFVDVHEIISTILENFAALKDPQDQAEIFQWANNKAYSLAEIYDEEGHINKIGIIQILRDLNIIIPVPESMASNIIQRQELLLESFLPATGFSTWAEFEEALNKSEKLKSIRDAFNNDALELAIYAPAKKREDILKHGFLNQYQTGTSKGAFTLPGRSTVERALLNMTDEEYEEIPREIRPKYGKVISQDVLLKSFPESQYGADLYLLRREPIQDRVTITPGDSLNIHLIKAKKHNLKYNNGDAYEPSKWNDIFVPWNKKNLIIPYLNANEFFSSANNLMPQEWHNPHKDLKNMPAIEGAKDYKADYLEFQVWGELSPAFIKSIIVSKNLPNRARLEQLGNYKIDTFYVHNNSILPYHLIWYEKNDNNMCEKFEFDKNKFFISECEKKYEDLLGKRVYDTINKEFGTINTLYSIDSIQARVSYTYESGETKTRDILIEKLLQQTELATKNTDFGPIEYRPGDLVYNPDRARAGYIKNIYQHLISVQYLTSDNTAYTYLDNIINIHKMLNLKQDNTLVLGQAMKFKGSRKHVTLTIQGFFDNHLVQVKDEKTGKVLYLKPGQLKTVQNPQKSWVKKKLFNSLR